MWNEIKDALNRYKPMTEDEAVETVRRFIERRFVKHVTTEDNVRISAVIPISAEIMDDARETNEWWNISMGLAHYEYSFKPLAVGSDVETRDKLLAEAAMTLCSTVAARNARIFNLEKRLEDRSEEKELRRIIRKLMGGKKNIAALVDMFHECGDDY
jgi:hypothetical protein